VIGGVTGNLAIDCAELTRKELRTLLGSCMVQGDPYIEVFAGSDSLPEAKRDVEPFFELLRLFMLDSLKHRVLFRGAVSIGDFFSVDRETNTIMGPAVTDAAEWYGRADWFGINATPHASIVLRSLLDGKAPPDDLAHLIVDYDVPLKDSTKPLTLKAVNWPKSFYLKGHRPEGHATTKSLFLEMLTPFPKPRGTESKYINAIKFFDEIVKAQELGKKVKTLQVFTSASS
jgi:hypothetical protein